MKTKESLKSAAQSWGLLVAALALGVVAFFASNWYLSNKERALTDELLAQREGRRQVVVAKADLQPGVAVSGENMALAMVPDTHLSANAVTPEQFDAVANRVLVAPMSRGEPLLMHFVAGEFAERFSDLLLEGERAVTLPVDDLKSSEGMLEHGDRVDLLLLAEQEGGERSGGGGQSLYPLVENVRLLATGTSALATREADFGLQPEEGYAESTYSTVTVGVNAEQAAQLMLAKDMGTVVVLLRNRRDESPLEAESLSAETLLGGTRPGQSYSYIAGSNAEGGSLRPVVKQVSAPPRRRQPEAAIPRREPEPSLPAGELGGTSN
ncbi:Flp pilus assembly protein CpaB [Aquimonas voraii]|uniref:Pilus assembly protein CpaB n=1 Tax=Aquimonas voraii TaxID=265719 RepID=A0A1G6WTM9_9GAMM|nr:Flp pilus assembly protein CpaB [Aquimonas voraii]SDD69290.1 pilus assembly protein CpaB [Aquimonas voraii]